MGQFVLEAFPGVLFWVGVVGWFGWVEPGWGWFFVVWWTFGAFQVEGASPGGDEVFESGWGCPVDDSWGEVGHALGHIRRR